MQKHNLPQKVKIVGDYLQQKLEKLKEQYLLIGDIRGKGLMWGIEFVANSSSREPYPPALHLASKIVQECFENRLIVYPSQKFFPIIMWLLSSTSGDFYNQLYKSLNLEKINKLP